MKISILAKFLCGAVLPILVLGGVIYYIAETTFRSSVLEQAENTMRNTATCTLAAYETNSGEYYISKTAMFGKADIIFHSPTILLTVLQGTTVLL